MLFSCFIETQALEIVSVDLSDGREFYYVIVYFGRKYTEIQTYAHRPKHT